MINYFVTTCLYVISSDCTSKEYNPIFIISSSLNSLLCILLLPVTIRLAGQLIAQVFKYRYIVNNCIRDCDDDSKVITAYYQHFQIFLGIVLCVFGFCIFNPIFLIYSSVSVIKQEWDRQYTIGYVAGAISQSFQEGIVLFGVTLLLQIANYFKGKKVQLRIITILIIARMGYIFIFQSTQVILQLIDLNSPQSLFSLSQTVNFYSIYADFFILPILNAIDTITRVFTIFAFMRMCIMIVHKRIIEFITDLNTNFLEWQRYEDKIRAFKLMKIAAWGTYSLTIINFLDTLSCVMIFLLIEWKIIPDSASISSSVSFYTSLYVLLGGLIFVSILSILPSILYSIFLVTAWLVFRHRTRVRYSGFRTNDVTREQLIPTEPIFTNQDHLHQTYYKHKNKIHLISYVILIISASSLFSLFLTPLMIQHSRQSITLNPGEYQMFDNTVKDCALLSYYLGKDFNPFTFLNPYSENEVCSTNLKGLKFERPFKQSLTTQYNVSNYFYRITTWIPQNSTIPKYCYYSLNGTVFNEELSVVLYFPSETPRYSVYNDNNYYCLTVHPTTINSSQGLYNIETSGMYYISILDNNYDTRCIFNITRSIDRIIGDRVPYSHFSQGTNIAELDAIIYEPTGDKVDYDSYYYCYLNIVCYYNPVWPILFGMSVFLVTVLIQVLLLYCIHRI